MGPINPVSVANDTGAVLALAELLKDSKSLKALNEAAKEAVKAQKEAASKIADADARMAGAKEAERQSDLRVQALEKRQEDVNRHEAALVSAEQALTHRTADFVNHSRAEAEALKAREAALTAREATVQKKQEDADALYKEASAIKVQYSKKLAELRSLVK